MTTDISEKGMETIIMRHMTGTDGLDDVATMVAETPDEIAAKKARGIGYCPGNAKDFDRAHAIDVPQLFAFLKSTQPEAFKKLDPPAIVFGT